MEDESLEAPIPVDWDDSPEKYDYLEGVEDPELPERHRISPSLTHYFSLGKIESMARLQYNYDHADERDDAHSIWLQFGFEWGAGGDAHVH